MSVRAKFRVGLVESTWEGKATHVVLSPVHAGDNAENDSFFEATPSGSIELWVKNEVAAKQFELYKEYYIDFTLAE